MKRFSVTALLGAFVALTHAAPSLVVYPAPAGIPASASFAVKVRAPGGEWRELFCYAVEVDMHQPRLSSVAIFDFSGTVEVAVTSLRTPIRTARIRPLSYGIKPEVKGSTVSFSLTQPRNLSVEINDEIYDNLQLFVGAPDPAPPDPQDANVIYFGPGVHEPGRELRIPSGKTVYLAGGAVVKTKLVCDHVEHVRILGHGVLYQGQRGVEITYSKQIEIDGITVINPTHYTVYGGQSEGITIRNLKAFSSRGWSDGIDLMSCSDVVVDGVFMRNSDDCIAIYGHRWGFYGDSRNVTVQNSALWADVAHPILVGTHGSPAQPTVIENLTFVNLDILNHDEPQLSYQGCIALNASDANLIRHVRVDHVRVEDFEQGQLVNLRVVFNRKYSTAPGRGIEDVRFTDLSYNGSHANISIITGYDETRGIRNVVFENLRINGQLIRKADAARFFVGEHVTGLEFRESAPPATAP